MRADDASLFTDLYELAMLRAYQEHGMDRAAVFDLTVHRLPPERAYLVAGGLEDVLDYLETFRIPETHLDALANLEVLSDADLEWLRALRFEGDVDAMPEGTPCFADEPLLRVEAPLPQAQVIETYVINQVHLQTLLASKGARVMEAAAGASVVDFGARRAHGTDAAMKAARSLYLAGFDGTSNVLAALEYDIPAAGTMAHSYIQAHEDELEAFRSYVATHPRTTLLVDTYDTLEGVRHVVALARELGDDFALGAIRLDSGDLAAHARDARALLDAAGLGAVRIVASGGLDEHSVAALVASGAPIDAYGVGTAVITSSDAPTLDMVYKLAAYDGDARAKRSEAKRTLGGRKQVYRYFDANGVATSDTLALAEEPPPTGAGPLLVPVMRGGHRLAPREPPDAARVRTIALRATIPERLRILEVPSEPYPVEVTAALQTASR